MIFICKFILTIILILPGYLIQGAINDPRNDGRVPCYNSTKTKICCVTTTACTSIPLLAFGTLTSNIYATSIGATLLGADLVYVLYKAFSLIDDDEVLSRPENYYARYSQSNFPDNDDVVEEDAITETL